MRRLALLIWGTDFDPALRPLLAAGSFGVVRRDHPFLLFVFSSVLASMTCVSIDALLPISLATSHGIPPAVWDF